MIIVWECNKYNPHHQTFPTNPEQSVSYTQDHIHCIDAQVVLLVDMEILYTNLVNTEHTRSVHCHLYDW